MQSERLSEGAEIALFLADSQLEMLLETDLARTNYEKIQLINFFEQLVCSVEGLALLEDGMFPKEENERIGGGFAEKESS